MSRKVYKSLMSATNTVGELILIYAGTLLVSAALFSFFEHKPIQDAIWWACVTGMTVGYGDLYPTTIGGKIVGVVLMHSTVLFILPLIIGRVASNLIENRNEFTHEEQEKIKDSLEQIKKELGI